MPFANFITLLNDKHVLLEVFERNTVLIQAEYQKQ